MIGRLMIPCLLLLLGYGSWASPNFNEIAAGVAIFLFGMLALEQGFRAFAGSILDAVLKHSTDRLWKSLTFGILTTTLVQSSSLVSILTISFLSAGLISLAGGIGIIFGANLGTTTGAWLVAGFGLKLSLSTYAMPLLTFGVVLIFQRSATWKGLGYVLAGLGFLFLGIDYMKNGFEAFRATIDLSSYAMPGLAGLLTYTLIGAVATVIMQSSHATLVLILAALAAAQISYENALALAIGSNVGTTVTAVLGSLGANVEGRRLAAAHLCFNLLTGLVAIVFIGPFRRAVDHLAAGLGIAADDFTLKLAVFHTLFNLAGICLMLPLIRPLETGLQRLIRVRAPAVSQPRYLNDAAREFPEAALEAVRLETRRLCDTVIKILLHGLSLKPGIVFSDRDLEEAVQASRKPIREDIDEQYHLHVKSLYSAIVEFISLAQVGASQQQSEQLHALRVAGGNLVEALKAVKHLRKNLLAAINSGNPAVRREYDNIRILLARVLRHIDTLRKTDTPPVTVLSWDELRLEVEEADLSASGELESLIRHNRISATVATSLMNDIGYCQNACRKLIEMTNTLFPGSDPQFTEAEQSLSLDDTEIERIARTSPDKAA